MIWLTGETLRLVEGLVQVTLQPTLPVFLALLDVPVEDSHWQNLDPAQRRQRALEACKRLLLRESQVQPRVVVFENLHWIDSETQAFLDSLVGAEGVQIAEEVDHPFSLIQAYSAVGSLYLHKGELQKSISGHERGLELSRVLNLSFLFPFMASPPGYGYALSGRIVEALPLVEKA